MEPTRNQLLQQQVSEIWCEKQQPRRGKYLFFDKSILATCEHYS